MTNTQMLQTLRHWQQAGWLRSLDVAMASLVAETEPAAPASLLLAAALASHLEGHGHSGLPLQQLASNSLELMGWPMEATRALQAALEVWPDDLTQLQQTWGNLAAVELNPADQTGVSPLVLAGDLLYLRRYWRYETRVAAQIAARVSKPASGTSPDEALDKTAARAELDRLFAPAKQDGTNDWQKIACALALRARLTIITGGPGTGKTYTAARLLVLLQSLHSGPPALRVALAAPTGKAAARLRQSISQALGTLVPASDSASRAGNWAKQLAPARTLHALLGVQPGTRRFRHNIANPLDVDVLFVDEASMVHLEMMAQLLDALPARSRLILLGDKDQLASVEAGAVLGELCQGAGQGGAVAGYNPDTAQWLHQLSGEILAKEDLGPGPALAQQTVMLRHSRRFDGPIGNLAAAVNSGSGSLALQLLRADSGGQLALVTARDPSAVAQLATKPARSSPAKPNPESDVGAAGSYSSYLKLVQQARTTRLEEDAAWRAWASAVLRSFDSFRVLCAVRDGPWGVSGLNVAIESALAQAGFLPTKRSPWYEGRPVMVTRNDPALGVFNGDIGIVLRGPDKESSLRCVFLDGDTLRSVAVSRLADVQTAFAMTVHKSQGSEFAHVVLVLPEEDVPVLTRELIYTGITRASQAFTLVARQPGMLNAAVGRLTRRVSGLRRMM